MSARSKDPPRRAQLQTQQRRPRKAPRWVYQPATPREGGRFGFDRDCEF
jgi:hypothetical protein